MIAAILAAGCATTGCTTGRMGPQPFSKRWANEHLQEKEFAARVERIGKPLFRTSDDLQQDSRGQNAATGVKSKHGRRGIVLHQFKW